MKIVFLTTVDLDHPETWLYGMIPINTSILRRRDLMRARGWDVVHVRVPGDLPMSLWHRVKRRYFQYKKQNYVDAFDASFAKERAAWIDRCIAEENPDIVLCPENLYALAYLRTQVPVVLWTDAVGTVCAEDCGFVMCGTSWKEFHRLERRALQRIDLQLYSSHWARESAIARHGVNPARVQVLEFGPNQPCVIGDEEVRNLLHERSRDATCRLLFIGKDWDRKGGAIAVQTAHALLQRGHAVELTLIGGVPPADLLLPPQTRVLGYVDVHTDVGRSVMDSALRRAHVLILPSRAECCSIVFSEANAYGVPCITSDAGGNATVIQTGVNGVLIPLAADHRAYVDAIEGMIRDPVYYATLSRGSRTMFTQRLDWPVILLRLEQILQEVCAR